MLRDVRILAAVLCVGLLLVPISVPTDHMAAPAKPGPAATATTTILVAREPATHGGLAVPSLPATHGDPVIPSPLATHGGPAIPSPPATPSVPSPRPARPVPHHNGPVLDVVFCLDTTGSMGDEIAVAKQTILGIASTIATGEPTPRVNYALVIYRDLQDVYVTRVFDFMDAERLAAVLQGVIADGGDDYPESVSEAIDRAVHDVNWTKGSTRAIYLIGDAPPHLDYDNGFDYERAARDAAMMGIVINSIGCSGIGGHEREFIEVTNITGGRFVYLQYGSDREEVLYYNATASTGGLTEGPAPGDRSTYEPHVDCDDLDCCDGGPIYCGLRSVTACSTTASDGTGAAPNDLDLVLTELIKEQAGRAGVSYDAGA